VLSHLGLFVLLALPHEGVFLGSNLEDMWV
jgi:hypothetical protein